MSEYKGEEKRRTPRIPLTTFCPVSFDYKSHNYSAMMVDLSEKGARFRLSEYNQVCPVEVSDEISFDIKTPYGPSQCKGQVVWAQRLDDHFTFGVKFTEVPTDKDDPLLCLMDSTF